MSNSTTNNDVHAPVSGGCLCKAVRYKISFPADTVWPPKGVATCQCTQCRKSTGSLLVHMMEVKPANIEWMNQELCFREYSSSPGVFRGFCSVCGSSISWRRQSNPHLDICLGSLDQDVLLSEDGTGIDLCTPRNGQVWCENYIKGVTDMITEGRRYLKNKEDGSGATIN